MKIAVLCGGLSPERDVSLSTGRRVTLALKNLGHRAVMLDMYLGLEGFTGSAEEAFDLPLPASAGGIGLTEPDLDEIRRMRRTKSRRLYGERVLEVCAAADTVFMALHGRCGELAARKKGEYCVLASDLPGFLPEAVQSLSGPADRR